jgi:hypothetical protein
LQFNIYPRNQRLEHKVLGKNVGKMHELAEKRSRLVASVSP